MKKPLPNEQKPTAKQFVTIIAEEVPNNFNSELVLFEPFAKLSENNSLYFFIVYKLRAANQYTPVYKSEVRKSEKDGCQWNQVCIGSTDLCNDNVEQEIKIEFFRSVSSGKHHLLAAVSTTLAVIKSSPTPGAFTTPFNKKGKGELYLKNLRFEKKHSFLEYVFGGCDIDLSIAIDFTLSNGHPTSPESLHYFDLVKNQYL